MSPLRAASTDRFSLSVVHDLKHDAPKCPAGAVELPARPRAGAAFAADKPNGLPVPVLHEVETDAAGKVEGQLWEGEESVTEIGGEFIL